MGLRKKFKPVQLKSLAKEENWSDATPFPQAKYELSRNVKTVGLDTQCEDGKSYGG